MQILNNALLFFIMQKKILIVGLVIFMLGIALFIAGFESIERVPTYNNIMQIKNNEYATGCFTYHSGDIVVITGVNNNSGLICNEYINNVTEGNLNNYKIPVEKSSSNAFYYNNLKPGGIYVFIEFSNSKPAIGYTILSSSEESLVNIAGDISSIGIIFFIAGIIVMILGIFLKKKTNTQFILNKKDKKARKP